MSVIVRPILEKDQAQWQTLFGGYQQFYRGHIPPETLDATWHRILNDEYPMGGIVAELNRNLVGLAHFLYHDSTWNTKQSCYLEDLYVDKNARGTGAGRLLMEQVEKIAKENDAFRLYLHTQEYNSSARSLYDTILPLSSFIVYRKKL